jgi:hypothetical protein
MSPMEKVQEEIQLRLTKQVKDEIQEHVNQKYAKLEEFFQQNIDR